MMHEQLKQKVLQEVQLETILVRFFGYQENGGRCPICGEKHCIRPVEYEPGINGYECRTRGIEAPVTHLFVQGNHYPADYQPTWEGQSQLEAVSDSEWNNAILDMACMFLGIGGGSGQLWETDPDSSITYFDAAAGDME